MVNEWGLGEIWGMGAKPQGYKSFGSHSDVCGFPKSSGSNRYFVNITNIFFFIICDKKCDVICDVDI